MEEENPFYLSECVEKCLQWMLRLCNINTAMDLWTEMVCPSPLHSDTSALNGYIINWCLEARWTVWLEDSIYTQIFWTVICGVPGINPTNNQLYS
jgi:hypothetical protein